jgi:hypothetical protein
MDSKYQYEGKRWSYTNTSEILLDSLLPFLFFNAFQPGSEMDVRSQASVIQTRVGSRTEALK